MKKKLLTGVIAAILVALNVFAFSSSAAAPGNGGGSTRKYQTMCYCTIWRLTFCCTTEKTAETCKYACAQKAADKLVAADADFAVIEDVIR